MEKVKQYVALTLVGCLAIMAGGWFLLVSPKRAEAADVRAQAVAQEATNAGLRTKIEVLKAQAKDLPKKQADLARVAAKIPDNPGMPRLIRDLTAASTSAGVQLLSVTPGTPAVLAGAVGQPVAAAAPADPQAADADPAAAAAAPAAGAAGAAGAVGTLAAIPVAIDVVGGYFEVATFLANLENLSRAYRVTNLAIKPGKSPTDKSESTSTDDGRSLTTTITGSVFMAADRPAATPAVAPAK